jgi:hypothetical protein
MGQCARHPVRARVAQAGSWRARPTRPRAAAFVVLYLHVAALDLLHLGASHRRARYERAGGRAGRIAV